MRYVAVLRCAAATLLLACGLAFPLDIITTVAGTDWVFPTEARPAINTPFGALSSVAIGPGGAPYFASARIFRLNADGTYTLVAGNGVDGFSGDGGPALSASLHSPRGLSFDGQSNLYFVDSDNFRVRKITPAGTITTIAGYGQAGSGGDGGPALSATLGAGALDTAVDSAGNVYIADTGNRRVRQITPAGIIRTFAGTGEAGSSGDGGPALNASMVPRALAFDAVGNLYIGEGFRVRVVNTAGVITAFAGTGEFGYSGDGGQAGAARLGQIRCLALDSAGNLYIGDSNYVIRKVTPERVISTFAGNGTSAFSGDGGPATQASIQTPMGVASDPSGNLFIADERNFRLRKVAPSQVITTVAGNGAFRYGGDGGPAVSAYMINPTSVAVDAAGNIYVAEILGNRVRKITPFGQISTLAGTSRRGYSGDGGPAAAAALASPYSVVADPAGNVFIADTGNSRIRKITSAGVITTVAGNGRTGYSGDRGPATAASLNSPMGLALDRAGNLYLCDAAANVVRKVDTSGVITTVAGTGRAGFSGDGGPATQAALNGPFGVAVGTDGSLYISDEINARIRRVSPDGIITTVAGNGQMGGTGDGGPPLQATFSSMDDLKVDAGGNIYVASGGDNRIRGMSRDGVVYTVAGTGVKGLSGDGGPASRAQLHYPGGIALDPSGNLYIAERSNHRVRLVQISPPASIALSQTGLTFTTAVGSGVPPQSFNVVNGGQGTMNWTATATVVGGGPNWISLTPDRGTSVAGATAPAVEVRVNPAGLAAGDYYALVQVSAFGVPNSPQFVTVVLNVMGAAAARGAAVQPTGLIFVGTLGGAAPSAQSLQVSNLTTRELTYNSSIAFTEGRNWLNYAPASAAIPAGQSVRINVQPSLAGVTSGAYTAALTLSFSDGTTQGILLVLIVRPGGSPSAGKDNQTRAAACNPSRLLMVSTLLGNGFSALASWPVPMEVRVVDDCGAPLLSGTVGATFTNNDPPLQLRAVIEGRWAGTWQARNAAAVTVNLRAQKTEPRLEGTAQITGSLQPNPNPPMIAADGVLNAASFQLKAPIAPGSLVSIFGSKLATELRQAQALPLATEMAGTVGMIAGRPLPLLFTSDGQVNGMLPFDLATGVTHQMLIQRQRSISLPEPVVIAPAQPAIFTKDLTGRGQAIAVGVAPDGTQYLVEPETPLQQGHAVVLYCAGLGPVSPPVPDGGQAPLEPLSWTSNPVTVTIGGQEARVLFSGLAPGFAGLYQVNALVPEGIEKGPEVPIILTLAGQSSPLVTLPVQ